MAEASSETAVRQALDALDRTGLLFLHDARLDLTALVAGEPIRGRGGVTRPEGIFQVANALEDGGEALFVPCSRRR